MRRRSFLSTASCGLAIAQEARYYTEVVEAEFSVSTNELPIRVRFTDSLGRPIRSEIAPDQVAVEISSADQTVARVLTVFDVPVCFGLLVDMSQSQARLVNTEIAAAARFINLFFTPEDRAFIAAFGPKMGVVEPVTASRESLSSGLHKLPGFRPVQRAGQLRYGETVYYRVSCSIRGDRYPEVRPIARPTPFAARPTTSRAAARQNPGTLLYDAVHTFSSELNIMKWRFLRALIVLTDGIDHGSSVSVEKALHEARRNGVIVYAIRYFDPSAYANVQVHVDPTALDRICRRSGGRVLEVGQNGSLDEIFTMISDELRIEHKIYLRTGAEFKKPKVHEVRVSVREPRINGIRVIRVGEEFNPGESE